MGLPPNSLRRHGERNALPELRDFQFTFDFHDAIEPDVGCCAARSRYATVRSRIHVLTLYRAAVCHENDVSVL